MTEPAGKQVRLGALRQQSLTDPELKLEPGTWDA